MPFERDHDVLHWLQAMLGSPSAVVRRRALRLLEFVDCDERPQWLKAAAHDPEPKNRMTAVLVEAVVAVSAQDRWIELAESDMGAGELAADLAWEWEYRMRVCPRDDVPLTDTFVWTSVEDDALARRLATMKCGMDHTDSICLILSRRLVTNYTRAPKNSREAERWQAEGRPRYSES